MSIQVESSIIRLSCTTEENPPHPPAREINVNSAVLQSKKNGGMICVTEPITRRKITCNEELCEEGYDFDGDIGPFFDKVVDEGDIGYYTGGFIDTLEKFQGPMDPAAASTIEVVNPPVGAGKPLTSEKVQKLKVAELKVEVQRRTLSKNGIKAVICNRILEAVVKT